MQPDIKNITTPAPNDIRPIKEAMDRFKFQVYKVEFESWFNKNKLDDEYFTRHEMYWFAEQAWKAAVDIWFNKKLK